MRKLFHVDIVTPKGLLASQNAVSLMVPAELGYLGVLADHAPLVAGLQKGKIIITDSNLKTRTLETSGCGFMEILKNKVTLILSCVA